MEKGKSGNPVRCSGNCSVGDDDSLDARETVGLLRSEWSQKIFLREIL